MPKTEPNKFEDMECDDLKLYCRWDGPPTACCGGNPIMCEGRFCKEAYERYVEEFESEDVD